MICIWILPVYPRVGGGTDSGRLVSLSLPGLSPRGRGNLGLPAYHSWPCGSIPAWAGEPIPYRTPDVSESVYPRVGGGTLRMLPRDIAGEGLSPRGRGNPRECNCSIERAGSIPAWAGEPKPSLVLPNCWKVYPRVGGGTWFIPPGRSRAGGLSPRGRGNQYLESYHQAIEGSIPAWAGEPRIRTTLSSITRVYPRVGGGTSVSRLNMVTLWGLSPRGRGNPTLAASTMDSKGSIPAWAGEPLLALVVLYLLRVYPRVGGGTPVIRIARRSKTGLSPRGRGNHSEPFQVSQRARSIPAWAGEPWRYSPSGKRGKVYPRVGGGTEGIYRQVAKHRGLSPRGRGNLCTKWGQGAYRGSIPAWAGEPGSGEDAAPILTVYPRVGGGTSRMSGQRSASRGLSPRGRGNHFRADACFYFTRSIPAWAGEPARRLSTGLYEPVYPRVGGGTAVDHWQNEVIRGLSPRGRGNQGVDSVGALWYRSIPAWAGEPHIRHIANERNAVYPRVGGGTWSIEQPWASGWGLSPRGRGNPDARRSY